MGYLEDYIREIQNEIERKNAKKINDMLLRHFAPKHDEDEPKTVFIPEHDKDDDFVMYMNNNGTSGSSGGSECVGSYTVSGYTRADGTEVSDYVRTCGAAHLGSSNDGNNEKDNSEEEDTSENRDKEEQERDSNNDYSSNDNYIFDLYASKSDVDDVQAPSSGGSNSVSKRKKTYEKYLDEATKRIAQSEGGNEKFPLKDYYKIALDLADKSKTVQSNKRNKVFKADDLPKDVNQKVVLEKVARGLGLDLNNPRGLEKAKNTTVVVPTDSSQLVEVLKKSEKIKDLLKREYSNILDGKYEGKFYDNGITFELPHETKGSLDKLNLFLTIHNADIYDLKTDSDGSVSFVVSDFYDFEYMTNRDDDNYVKDYLNKGLKEVNNSAYRQQETGKLTPYALYIPVVISAEQLKEILSNSE